MHPTQSTFSQTHSSRPQNPSTTNAYDTLESIRILVGLDVDLLLYELSQKGFDPAHQDKRFRDSFIQNQAQTLESEDYTQDVETSFALLQDLLKSNKIQIRIVREKNVHAKFYVFSSSPIQSHTHDAKLYNGSLIVGSSNLTYNGLEKNYEVNLLTTESNDITYALSEFNRLWDNAVLITAQDIQSCTTQSYLPILSPKDLYYKLLLSHFGEESLTTDNSIESLFKGYTAYNYQIHAIQEGIAKLKKYNGFFLSDVVGLGKTLIASIIAQKCRKDGIIKGKILIITPPALKKSWKKHFDDIHITNYDITTHDSLHKLSKDEIAQIELIIIDESHNFRTSKTNRYQALQNLCKTPYHVPTSFENRKIMLLSATPQNNSPEDIKNQVYLFCNPRHSGIEGVENLEHFFSPLIKQFNAIKTELKKLYQQKPSPKDQIQEQHKKLEEINSTLREKLLTHIMIRRTRGDIQALYIDDMKAQNLKFPRIEKPKDLTYDLDSISKHLATHTLTILNFDEGDKNQSGFTYARYLIFPHLTGIGRQKYMKAYGREGADGEDFLMKSTHQLQQFIKQILFKRFDSSIAAFKSTLEKQITSHNVLLRMFANKHIYIPKYYDNRDKLYEAVLSENDEDLEKFLEEREDDFIALEVEDFTPNFTLKLEKDKALLQNLLLQWQQVEIDPKLDVLKDFLNVNQHHKMVLFTEAKTTADYLEDTLKNSVFKDRILNISAANKDSLEDDIRANFDANYPKEWQKDDYSLIVSTDVLAEGVNLHRADIIINYDTPYNATRLMQRIGRINRIGTSFEFIHIYNFKPTHLANEIININAIAHSKIQSFHFALGEDSAIYDENEIVESKQLYNLINQSNQEQSKDTEYLKDLRKLHDKDPKAFMRIKALPLKSRSIIESTQNESYAYIAHTHTPHKTQATRFYPYHIATNTQSLINEPEVSSSDFYSIADFLKAHFNAKILKPTQEQLKEHYSHINAALKRHEQDLKDKPELNAQENKLNPKDRQAIAKIRYCKELDESVRESLINALKNGSHTHLSKEIVKTQDENLAQTLKDLAEKYALAANTNEYNQDSSIYTPPQIQLSISTFTKGSKNE
ncbi:helicase-related protein [uncultured Helicobacter sp.]|nr:helicase-related protein [uncultured Helicobacter sp.]